MTSNTNLELHKKALEFHSRNKKGKIGIELNKKLMSKEDLALAYTPGVAIPCLEIAKNTKNAYEYTNKGNTVAVITNGTAVLGLGNIGVPAAKPVMEGKAALFKKFADIDAIDIGIDTKNPEKFIEIVKMLSNNWGGINLEDIKAPECFYIEEKLEASLDIPVFHDDQHGTSICTTAGVINALLLTNKRIENVKVVINGAGSAGSAIGSMLKDLGVKNLIMCDSKGVLYKVREEGMSNYKNKFAVSTKERTLAEAISGADIFIGVSVANALSPEMLKSMSTNPIVFALANPIPEIYPNIALAARKDVIIATGRSDFKNQVNNVLVFPYIFRGALDNKVVKITKEMKLNAAIALSGLIQQEIPKELKELYPSKGFSRDCIIPMIFDPRLKDIVPNAIK